MPGPVSFVFEWDPMKARASRGEHGVDFAEAMTVFHDPPALSQFDDESRIGEERWITLGSAATGSLCLVVRTWLELDADRIAIRIISARSPTRKEARQYGGEP